MPVEVEDSYFLCKQNTADDPFFHAFGSRLVFKQSVLYSLSQLFRSVSSLLKERNHISLFFFFLTLPHRHRLGGRGFLHGAISNFFHKCEV